MEVAPPNVGSVAMRGRVQHHVRTALTALRAREERRVPTVIIRPGFSLGISGQTFLPTGVRIEGGMPLGFPNEREEPAGLPGGFPHQDL
jgi:hypothetical protein